jgi:Ca-activated chloride channel family protein
MVQLRVAVTDHKGNYVTNLEMKDFRVLENGVEQKIQAVAPPAKATKAETSVFILFDTSNRMYDDFPRAEDAVADFIRGLAPSDNVALYGFSRNVCRLAPPGRDRLETMVGLRHAVAGDNTSLYDAMLVTLREASKIAGNKTLVVFSNGPDNASLLSPEEVRAVAEDEGIQIYVVSTKDYDALSNAAFHDVTARTGGKTYIATSWDKQKLAFEAIDEDLNNSYVVEYFPAPSDAAYRKIDVQVVGDTGQTYRVRSRAGYHRAGFSQP